MTPFTVAAKAYLSLYPDGGDCADILKYCNYTSRHILNCIADCSRNKDWFGQAIMRALLDMSAEERDQAMEQLFNGA